MGGRPRRKRSETPLAEKASAFFDRPARNVSFAQGIKKGGLPMYQYEYETLYVGGGFWMNNAGCQHREIIARRAAQDWRDVG